MRKILLTSCFLASTALIGQSGSIATGTWSWSDASGKGGYLLTFQEKDEARFQLECDRGGPSYNSGFIEGRMKIIGRRGVFHSDEFSSCEFTFDFQKDRVIVKQKGDSADCGFGGSVYADGIYFRKSRKKPRFFNGDPRSSDTKRE